MKKLFLLVVSLLPLLAPSFTYGQRPKGAVRPTSLRLHQPITRIIRVGEIQVYPITLKEGDYLYVELLQMSINAELFLYDANNNQLVGIDDVKKNGQRENLYYRAQTSGEHEIRVYVRDQVSTPNGKYTIQLMTLGQADEKVRKVIDGNMFRLKLLEYNREFTRAKDLYDKASKSQTEGEINQAISLLHELEQQYIKHQSLSLWGIGLFEKLAECYSQIDNFETSYEYYEKLYHAAQKQNLLNLAIDASEKLASLETIKKRAAGIFAEPVVQTGQGRAWSAAAYSQDGSILAIAEGLTIKLWDTKTGREIRSFRRPFADDNVMSVIQLAFSPDNKQLISLAFQSIIDQWDIKTGKKLSTFSFADKERGFQILRVSPNGKLLALGGSMECYLLDAQTGREIQKLPWGNPLFSPDSNFLLSENKLYRIGDGKLIRTFPGAERYAFTSDGKAIAGLVDRNKISIWELKNGEEIRSFPIKIHEPYYGSAYFSPDGQLIALRSSCASSNSDCKIIQIYDVSNGVELASITGNFPDHYGSIVFSPTSSILATTNDTGKVDIWDAIKGAKLQTLETHAQLLMGTSISLDGISLKISDRSGFIKNWNLSSNDDNSVLRTVCTISYPISVFDISPDGKNIAYYSPIDYTLRVWNLLTRTEIINFKNAAVQAVLFSPDGKVLAGLSDKIKGLAILSDNKPAYFWNIETGLEIPSPNPLPDWVKINNRYKSHYPSGDFAFIARQNQIKVINHQTGKPICSLFLLGTSDWAVVTPEGIFNASPGAMKLMHFVISGIDEGYAIVTLDQMKDRYYQPDLLPKLLGFDNTPIRKVAAFTGEKLFPKVDYAWREPGSTTLDIRLRNSGGGIGAVAVLINGNTWLNDIRPRGFDPNAKEAAFTVDLKDAPWLVGAPDQVEVVARNAEGWLTSARSSSLAYEVETETVKPAPALWAIVGGVSDYAGTQLDLNFAAKDAEDFANAVKLGGYRLFGAERVHLRVLTTNSPDARLLPSKENFRRVFAEFQQAKPNDVLLVYLSGHGVAFRQDGDRVLYSYLTQTATSGDLKDSGIRARDAITSEELMEWIRLIKTNKNILVFDTCAAGAFADNLNLAIKKDDAGEYADNQRIALKQLESSMAYHILMGSAANKPSYETSQYNQGLLTYALLEGIKFGAVKEGGLVQVNELFQYARNRVPKLAESIGNANIQTPQLSAPRNDNIPLLQMQESDAAAIRLEQERPIILRPRLINADDFDDTELEKLFIRRLREASRPVRRGDAARNLSVVFLENVELPSALKPSGNYKYDGEQVTVNLRLLRDKQTVRNLMVTGKKSDLSGLIDKLVAEIVTAIK